MRAHTWAIEEVDGGPAGSDDVYSCTECGCGGGGSMNYHTMKANTPRPFLPGPALNLSEDCDEAQTQIYFFVQGTLRCLWARQEPEVATAVTLLTVADKFTPKDHPRVAFSHLPSNIDRFAGQTDIGRRSQLVGMGFKLMSSYCEQCGNPTDRYGDDPDLKCYGCRYAESRKPALT